MTQVPELQKLLLDYATSQALSHGAMLFAGVSASFSFLRVIDSQARDTKEKSSWFIPGSFLVLCILVAFSTYTLFKLLYYGVYVSQVFSIVPLVTHQNITQYNQYIFNFTEVGFQSGPIVHFMYTFFGIKFFVRRVFWSISLSYVFSNLLLRAFANTKFNNFYNCFCQKYSKLKFWLFWFSYLLLPIIILFILS